MKTSRSNTYNVEIPIEVTEEKNRIWILIKFDPINFINKYLLQYKDFHLFTGITEEKLLFKSFEIVSTVCFRGIFISNLDYQVSNLPKEIMIKSSNNKPVANVIFFDICLKKEINNFSQSFSTIRSLRKSYEITNSRYNINNGDIMKINDFNFYGYASEVIRDKILLEDENFKKTMYHSKNTSKNKNGKIKSLNSINIEEQNFKIPLTPDPILNLNFAIGYSSQNCPSIFYNSHGDYQLDTDLYNESRINPTRKHIYFASGPNIIKFDPYNMTQKFFIGHSKPVSNFIIGCKGELLFSGQKGINSIIRIWKTENCKCLKMLTTPLDKLKSLSENKTSNLLCACGNEQLKELIIIWNIQNLNDIKIYLRQNVLNSINVIKFVPYSENTLISCGNENIKFYRIKNNKLFGKSVVLNQYSKNNKFLCIGFNKTIFSNDYNDKGKVFIGSSSGCVFQIACINQELESVYKIQNSQILSLSINEVFCATGSLDGYTRLWPIDFSEFLLEAKHDNGVCSVDISYDSIEILCGTLGGSIGILNVKNKNYKTILRTPNNDIIKLIVHPSNNYILTIENKGIVRIWDIQLKTEIFEFCYEKDLPVSIAAPLELFCVCGHLSGIINVFDIEKSIVIYKCKPFKGKVSDLLFIQNYKILICMSGTGNLSVHDAKNNYKLIKTIDIELPTVYADISISVDNDFFSTIGSESKCALTWNCLSLGMKNNISIENKLIKKITIINKNLIALILDDCSIRFYALGFYEGVFIKEFTNFHINNINKLIVSNNFKYFITSGEEGMIKIWDMNMIFNDMISYQQFIGHYSSIEGLILIEKKGILISSSENCGIYFWNFLGDITFNNEGVITELKKLEDKSFLKKLREKNMINDEIYFSISKRNMTSSIKNCKTISFSNQRKSQLLTKHILTDHMQRKYDAENPETIKRIKHFDEIDDEKVVVNETKFKSKFPGKKNELIVLPVLKNKDKEEIININYSNKDFVIDKDIINYYIYFRNSEQVIKNKILYYCKHTQINIKVPLSEKVIKLNSTKNKKLNLKYVLGLSTNSINNIVFNKINQWYAYTINNKIIIEFLINERKQIILSDANDELNCLILSPNNEFLISAVGHSFDEEYAPIFVYNANKFSLIKKITFHLKGVQYISIPKDNKYMISIGAIDEKTICIWNFKDFSMIYNKTVENIPFHICYFDYLTENFDFISCSFDNLTFWKLNKENILENIDISFKDLNNINNKEFITGMTIYKKAEDDTDEECLIKQYHIILSTNKGNIILVDKEQKKIIKKYLISKFTLTKIIYYENYFLCAGEGPLIYIWKLPGTENRNNKNNLLMDIVAKQKPKILFIDGAVNSLTLSNTDFECLLSTDKGSLFCINFEKNNIIKLLSSHQNTTVSSINSNISDTSLITVGKNDNVRCWAIDTFDQMFFLNKKNESADFCLLSQKDNILLTLYESSYISIFNIKTLKSLGSIEIPNEDIFRYNFIFNNSSIILITHQKNIYLIQIQSWDPLSMLFTLIDIPRNDQKCQGIICKNEDVKKSYACFYFSDGGVFIYFMEEINGKININLSDKFNMIELHASKYNDDNSKELYDNLINYKSDYNSFVCFSNEFDDLVICFHDRLQFLFIRNFMEKQTIQIISLNYSPVSLNISENGNLIAIGTKEGVIIFINVGEKKYYNNYNLNEIYEGHCESVKDVYFSHNSKHLFTSSKNELFVWEIKL